MATIFGVVYRLFPEELLVNILVYSLVYYSCLPLQVGRGLPVQMASFLSIAYSSHIVGQSFLCPVVNHYIFICILLSRNLLKFLIYWLLLSSLSLYPPVILNFYLYYQTGWGAQNKEEINVCGLFIVLRQKYCDFIGIFLAIWVFVRKHLLIFYIFSLL